MFSTTCTTKRNFGCDKRLIIKIYSFIKTVEYKKKKKIVAHFEYRIFVGNDI
jgi:hypothetical protein